MTLLWLEGGEQTKACLFFQFQGMAKELGESFQQGNKEESTESVNQSMATVSLCCHHAQTKQFFLCELGQDTVDLIASSVTLFEGGMLIAPWKPLALVSLSCEAVITANINGAHHE